MTYGWKLALVGLALALLVLGSNGWLIKVSKAWASDDLNVGHGSSSFPPQGGAR